MPKLYFKPDKKYTFSDYFEFNNPSEDIAHEFGYGFSGQFLHLKRVENFDTAEIQRLQNLFYANLPRISLNSEMAKRDFMIAPLLWELLRFVDAKIKVEYPIEIDDKLGGVLDYLLSCQQSIVVIEAKKADIEKGFNQLIAELIAMDKYIEFNHNDFLYGAVSTGGLWRFGWLERQAKHVSQDLHSYRVPEDIEQVFTILLGILQN